MDIVTTALSWLFVAAGLFLVLGTLLSLSRHPHWFIRGWDFPRVQIAVLIIVAGGGYAVFSHQGQWYDWAFLATLAACLLWQIYKIYPYTLLAAKQVKQVKQAEAPQDDAMLRLLISNVEQDNDQYDHWLQVVRAADPDVLLALEVDASWDDRIATLAADYPYTVRHPQDNCYGMVLLSRLKLVEPEVRFIVQDDIPSIHTQLELRNGRHVYLHGVHPRPPEPVRGQDAVPRDAELVVVGREIGEEETRPTIVAGDFNDVGWSHTTSLFCQLSGLLDPRVGRGFYNTFDANNPLFRFPLDHVFHSNEFELVKMELLEYVGSDHFPVYTELYYHPAAPLEQPEPEADSEQQEEAQEEAQEKLEHAAEDDGNKIEDPDQAEPPHRLAKS